MKRKNIILSVLGCVLIFAISFGITYAYLVAQDNAMNVFKVGESVVEVEETFKPPKKLLPGISFVKKPHVNNTGNLPNYVRMRADFSDSRAKAFCEPLDINTENWEYNAVDGYYYYKHLLNPGEKTIDLFTTVTIKSKKDDGSNYTEANMLDFDILIYAESTQHTDHEGDCPIDEYLRVW